MEKRRARATSAGVTIIADELTNLRVRFSREATFEDCCDQRRLPFDFQIIVGGRVGLIEFDGEQHFAAASLYNQKPGAWQKARRHDAAKTAYAAGAGIPLLRLAYDLEPAALRENVRTFAAGLRKSGRTALLVANDPHLYDYLRPRKAPRGCAIL